jgi:hypothetical protein
MDFDTDTMTDARYWLLDCGADPDLVDEATDLDIYREVKRRYEGGWGQFLRDGQPT